MAKIQLTLFVFSVGLCLAFGWEPGSEFVYKYVGRSIAGIYKLKQQNSVIEVTSRVIVQSIDDNTLLVKLSDSRIKRNGKYLGNPYFINEDGHPEEIDGTEDQISDIESLGAAFTVTHSKGSVSGVEIDAGEPLWIVNFKKSIAGQLQLDVTGVRLDSSTLNTNSVKESESTTLTVLEDSVTGDCSTTIDISRLPWSRVTSTTAFQLESFEHVCKNKPVYQIVKTKDYNRCQTNPVWHSTTSNVYTCDFNKANCGEYIKRSSVSRYFACGESLSQLTIVQANVFGDLVAQPFATKTDELVHSTVGKLSLEKKSTISSRLTAPSSPKKHSSLSYVFDDFEQRSSSGTPVKPSLTGAYFKSPVPVSTLHKSVVDALIITGRDLKERADSDKDDMGRMAAIAATLPMFSLDELRLVWKDIKDQDCVIVTLFIDCLVQAGTNPTVMLLKELIETEQITGRKAEFTLSAFGYYVKTPTRELLREIIGLLKSSVVQSSKTMFQLALMGVADLMNEACSSTFSASKRFSVSVLGDFCSSKDSVLIDEYLPLLVKELESQEVFDRFVALTAFGSLGTEDIVPILLPIIRGTPGKFDDTAERVRAILSLHRVVFDVPEKLHPMLNSLASNVGERYEVRMAALGLLLMSNAPLVMWQKFAAASWFEPNRQMGSYIQSLIDSLSKVPPSTPLFDELGQKGRAVLLLVKPAPFGLPYSFADIRSSHMDEGISVMMHTISYRDSDQSWPVYLANVYHYRVGPLNNEPFGVYMWNFNMANVWENVFNKIYGRLAPKYGGLLNDKAGEPNNFLKDIWDELKATPKPADKRAGLFHINLLGSINRLFNLEQLDDVIPKFMADLMNYRNKPYEVSVTKYRMLAEYNVRFPTELGLPLRYSFNLPMLVSMHGNIEADGKNGIKSDVSTQLAWKVSAELRADMPATGNYIATGVDVLVDSRAPRLVTFDYKAGLLQASWIPDSKVTDLFVFHVKPYTVTRNFVDTLKPTLEDQAVNLISVTDKPIHREYPLSDLIGVNVKFVEDTELAHSDVYSWFQWLSKWDINSLSNMGFFPLELHNRKYIVRYEPTGTHARTVSTSYFYQYATKSNQNTVVFDSGSSQSRTSSSPEVTSYSPIAAEFQPVMGRMFDQLDSGNARLARASLTSEYTDGSLVHFSSVFGMAMDARYTKDVTDWQVEYSTVPAGGTKKIENSICYYAERAWNNPPTYGFSEDVLSLSEFDLVGFGAQCEHNVRFEAKLHRDGDAAKYALSSPAGLQCQKDMASGFKYGSPACTKARRLDHTYNNYELVSQANNMTNNWLQMARRTTTFVNHLIYPFTVEHTHDQKNFPYRASWTTKRDPKTGDNDMIFVRPHETVVAKNVRWGTEWERFSPLTFAYTHIFYPLNAGSNHIIDAADITSAGVSESKCYVGDDAVYTFDGAHYKYTINDCPHVLMTDCHKKSNLAVMARQGREGQKIVTVVYGKDTIELDPNGYAVVNGAKIFLKTIEKRNHIEIRTSDGKAIKAVIFPLADGGVMLDIRTLLFFLKVQGSHVELSAPVHMRGRACGVCGDFNQETDGEFKTADRCVLSAGELMAASFKLKSGDACAAADDISRRLKEETENCLSVDQTFHTFLPDYDVNAHSKCETVKPSTLSGTCSSP